MIVSSRCIVNIFYFNGGKAVGATAIVRLFRWLL